MGRFLLGWALLLALFVAVLALAAPGDGKRRVAGEDAAP